MFRIENDFVFRNEKNHLNRPLTPDISLIVKNISLHEIKNSENILSLLSNKISNHCAYLLRKAALRTPNMLFQVVKGHFTTLTGKDK